MNSYIFQLLAFLLLLCLTEAPKFYIQSGNYEKAKQVIHKIYKTHGTDGQAARITRFIDNTGDQKVTKVSITEAFFTNPLYTRSSWTALAVAIFHVFTGDTVIRFLLPTLVKELMPESY